MKKNVLVFSLFSLLCTAGMTLLNSCLKQDNTPPQQQARISLLQASPAGPAMDLYMNGTKINSGQVINYPFSAYFPQKPGNYSISFADAASGDTLVSHTDSVMAGGLYSLIVYDTGSRRDFMFFPDQFEQSSDNSTAYIRFLQLSPDAGLTDLYVGTTKKYVQRGFADNLQNSSRAEFGTITPGTYSFTAISSATGDTLGSQQNITLVAGGAYTLFLQGLAGRTDSLGVKLNITPY